MTQHADLFDTAARIHRLRRVTDAALFLHKIARDEVLENLNSINRTFTRKCIVTDFPQLFDTADFDVVAPADTLKFPTADYDVVIHFMALHSANDPVGQLIQCHRALRPDGLCLAACFGGDTLAQARTAMMQAEISIHGGAAPRFHPMADVRDLGGLLQRAGFSLPVADRLVQNVSYENLMTLFHDLRGMGEANSLNQRQKTTIGRAVLAAANAQIATTERFDITFELMFLSGWVPHESQQTPLRPGSAKMSLLDALSPTDPKQND